MPDGFLDWANAAVAKQRQTSAKITDFILSIIMAYLNVEKFLLKCGDIERKNPPLQKMNKAQHIAHSFETTFGIGRVKCNREGATRKKFPKFLPRTVFTSDKNRHAPNIKTLEL